MLVLLAAGIGSACLLVGIVNASDRNGFGAVVALVFAGLFLGLGIYGYTAYGRKQGSLKIFLFSEGFVYILGEHMAAFPWRQTTEVQMYLEERNGSRRSSYTIRRADGSVFRFGSLNLGADTDTLGQHMAESVARSRLPQALADLQAGKDIPFGKVALNAEGIRVGNTWRSWSEVEQMFLEKGFLYVCKPGQGKLLGLSVAVTLIPNIVLLLRLAEYARQQKQRR